MFNLIKGSTHIYMDLGQGATNYYLAANKHEKSINDKAMLWA